MIPFDRILKNKSFSVRFQKIKDDWEPRTAEFVVNQKNKKEFFKEIEELELVTIYSDNDVWHIKAGVDSTDEKFMLQMGSWYKMYYKCKWLSEIFKSERKVYFTWYKLNES